MLSLLTKKQNKGWKKNVLLNPFFHVLHLMDVLQFLKIWQTFLKIEQTNKKAQNYQVFFLLFFFKAQPSISFSIFSNCKVLHLIVRAKNKNNSNHKSAVLLLNKSCTLLNRLFFFLWKKTKVCLVQGCFCSKKKWSLFRTVILFETSDRRST